MADTATQYPYSRRELERAGKELERLLTHALWVLAQRDKIRQAR
jgi:hypothetical protein